MQYLYTRQYKVNIADGLIDLVQEYDELYDTNYKFELIDACTRATDVGNHEGTMYLQLDDDGSGMHSWFDEVENTKPVLFTVPYDVEEHDADYENMPD